MSTHMQPVAILLCISTAALAHPHDAVSGWQLTAPITDHFEASRDSNVTFRGKPSARLQSDVMRADLASLIQTIDADQYKGKRIRFSTYAKTKSVEGWTGAWIRIDSRHSQFRSYEDTHHVDLRGDRDWTALTLVLDVPEDARSIDLGLSQEGSGTSWFGPVSVETVDDTVRTTFYSGGRNYATGPLSCMRASPTGTHIRYMACYNLRTGRTTYMSLPEYSDGATLTGNKVGTPRGWLWVWG
jgi:hypothetical protein